MKTNLFISLALSAAILGCGNSNYSINSNKQSSEPLAKTAVVATASGCVTNKTMIAWNLLSQAQMDALLLKIAKAEVGYNYCATDLECKAWVQKIVLAASGVTLGINTSGGLLWDQGTMMCMSNFLFRGSISPSSIGSLDIIQMYWRYVNHSNGKVTICAHTAIVISNDGTTMQWIDCNFTPCCVVAIHSVTCADFAKFTGPNSGASGTGYNVYHII
jgi:hypothetical protein